MTLRLTRFSFVRPTTVRKHIKISQLPNLFRGTPKIRNFILLLIAWVRSFSKMLLSVKFAEDMVLVFVIYTSLFRHRDSENKPNNKTRMTRTTTQK